MRFLRLLNILIIAILAGCAPVSTPSATPTRQLVPSSTLSPTLAPSSTPQKTATPNQPTATAVPTWTADQAHTLILDWLQDNAGCRLPCLFGLTPGQSIIQSQRLFWSQFGVTSTNNFTPSGFDSADGGLLNFIFIENEIRVSISLTYYPKEGKIEKMGLSTFPTYQDEAIFGSDFYTKVTYYYQLSQLLTNYGPPSSVLIAVWRYVPFLKADYEVFSVVVIYEDQGILVEYIAPVEQTERYFQGCPQLGFLDVRVWDPKSGLTLREIAATDAGEGLSGTSFDYFRLIDHATSITIDEFYEVFKNPNNTSCLTTPAKIWP